ncbi:hypothetical protein CAPTEDRAFT_198654 [Capitella teleta]|uniref:Uncharacterized protein n=1 Tax=Capitella teleta TaxID=283909 RepID=R7V1Y4_CAPTE|nr:hypothetical protein CAPTEDRAFT_198654 [Capitella teleta]|eukprot:ELU12858.1 hypothetical protein CAPTEDRAFT_198654 [Capitella teleta]
MEFNQASASSHSEYDSMPSLFNNRFRRNTILKRNSIVGTNLLEGGMLSKLRRNSLECHPPTLGGRRRSSATGFQFLVPPTRRRESALTQTFEADSAIIKPSPSFVICSPSDINSSPQSENILSAVDEALETVVKMKIKRREDLLAGVPSQFAFGQSSIKVFPTEESTSSKRLQCSVTFMDSIRGNRSLDSAGPDAQSSTKSKASAPGSGVPKRFQFPKRQDFYPRKRRNDLNGYEWSLSGEKQNDRGHPGIICRCAYPVTEGLHREGTSVTTLKGIVPKSLDVSKVWQRPIDEMRAKQVIPLEMARMDTTLTRKMKSKKDQTTVC